MPPSLQSPLFAFDNSYARDLPGFSTPWQAARVPRPALVLFNRALADTLGLDADALDTPEGADIFAGNRVPDGATPIAQAYAGHQFGGFSPQLGDGRALLLGELIDRQGQRRDLQLKGSGPTPYSRRGDGKAALGPVLREYLMGEAMHALGIPTTRALAAVTTGEQIRRDGPQPGAVLARIAASHIRVGTFQFFAARGDHDRVRQLADYVIARHDPDLLASEDRYLDLLRAVCERQARLVAAWMQVGFIHGVMNTDNMALSGETIDYGPCAFMDRYDPDTVFSSIDHHGRYAYANQPGIAGWNLARLAETLLPLIDADTERAIARATEVIHGFLATYEQHWLDGQRTRLGLTRAEPEDLALAQGFLAAMEGQSVDFTLAWRRLAAAAEGDAQPVRALFADPAAFDRWHAGWQARLALEPAAPTERAAAMRRVSPAFIARNHRVEAALAAAVDHGDLGPAKTLLAVLARPFDEQPEHADFALPPSPGGAPYQTFCGT
ncbi:protein adenylyltransferase SelO [Sphaerotilus sp.]|uniref:protein adenylyltransferase SelO n=1 Tax=Sphaerotilus sp. TaxID=2093942 RepID=UPI002ACEF97D|nr:YdiU family protein [Sphaerotilus sp.]MDZ7856911.1 YdiU family protein [Sphaerotilus sp.]